jgi:hypothetical protein
VNRLALLFVASSLAVTSPALAAEEAPSPAPVASFALPFQLRAPIARTLVRVDSIASKHTAGATFASVLTGSYSPFPDFAVLARIPHAAHVPDDGDSGSALGNPVLAAMYTPALRPMTRLSFFGGVALPLAQGGGDSPSPARSAAVSSGIYGRAAMDNALFAVDYAVGIMGAGIVHSIGICSFQLETTVLELVRVRAEQRQKDSSRTNLTAGASGGCYLRSPLQLIGELRYQRWLTTPAAVSADTSRREQATAGLGLRFDARMGSLLLRPGVFVALPIDDPMSQGDYRQLMLDMPIVF